MLTVTSWPLSSPASLSAACFSSSFMVFAAIYSHGMAVLYYLIVFVVVMAIGILTLFKSKKN